MSDNHEFLALDWVKSEIEESLGQARSCLEEYIKNTNDSSKIRFCLTHLHQVFGSLQMIEFHGAALLAEELENLCQGLLNGSVPKSNDTVEILMQGILQLPGYLEKIQETRQDIPSLILPLLNDLRATRGESLLSGTALFNPNLQAGSEVAKVDQKSADPTEDVTNILRKIRLTYQKSLVGIIRNQDLANNLGTIAKVFTKLENLSREKTASQLWWVAGALVEGLANGGIKLGVSTQLLLGVLDRHIKNIVEAGKGGLSEAAPVELLKNLLFYVGRIENDSPRIKAVKQAYQLDMAFDQASGAVVSDREALGFASEAIAEDLSGIKEKLDIYMNNKNRDVLELKKVIPGLKKLSDTLAVLGMGSQRKLMQEQVETLDWCVENPSDDSLNTKLLDVAGSILYLEASLTAFRNADEEGFKALADKGMVVSPEQLNEAQNAVIRESREGLEEIKDAIVNFMVSQWDKQCLVNIPKTLSAVRGGLMMVPLARPSSILEQCTSYIKEKLIDTDEKPAWDDMDTLADAISGVEYFLECLSEDSHADESVLDIAAESISKLGYAVTPVVTENSAVIESLDDDIDDNSDFGELSIDLDADADDLEQVQLEPANDINSEVFEIEADLSLDNTLVDLPEPNIEEGGENRIPDLSEEPKTKTEPVLKIEEEKTETQDNKDEDDFIDDEIIEIFIEEAGEVLATIDQTLPKWEENWQDEDSRSETRRAFHTLKGSGRMVGANEAGELAWAVENMMNRVIDKTIEPSEEMFVLIHQVVEHIPELVKAFEERRKPRLDLKPFMDAADIFAEGKIPEPLTIVESEAAAIQSNDIAPPILQTENSETIEHIETISDAELENYSKQLDVTELFNKIDDSIDEIFAHAIEDGVEDKDFYEPDDELVKNSNEEVYAAAVEEKQIIEIDADLLEIFTSEVSSHLAIIREFINHSIEATEKIYLTDSVLRALHTLKGSARMAGIDPIADVASPAEKISKEIAALNLPIKSNFIQLLQACVKHIDNNINSLLENNNVLQPITNDITNQLDEIRNVYLSDDVLQENDLESTDQVLSTIITENINEIFNAGQQLSEWQKNQINTTVIETFVKEMNVLGKSAAKAGLNYMEELCTRLSDTYNVLISRHLQPDNELFDLLAASHEHLIDMVDSLAAGQSVRPADKELGALNEWISTVSVANEFEVIELDDDIAIEKNVIDQDFIDSLPDDSAIVESLEIIDEGSEKTPKAAPERDPEIVEIFLEEATEILDESSVVLEKWIAEPDNLSDLALLQRHLHTLKGGARMAEVQEIGDLAHYLESLYESFAEDKLHASDILFDMLHRCHDGLAERVESIRSTGVCENSDVLIAEIKQYVGQSENIILATNNAVEKIETNKPVFDKEAQERELRESTADQEIVNLFLEEAEELLQNIENSIQAWVSEPKNPEFQDQIQRYLHTIKGGARLSELKMLGNAVHEFESYLIESERNNISVDSHFFDTVNGYYDLISQMFEFISSGVKTGMLPGEDKNEIDEQNLQQENNIEEVIELAESSEQKTAKSSEQVRESDAIILANKEFKKMQKAQSESQEAAAQKSGPQEMVRVSADLLESMINLAGETSISRARVEKEVSDFSFILEEMGMTIEKVQELLRRLNQETEEQILSGHEVAGGDAYVDFDPLEMDRYSQLHQLSRSMSESSVDLLELRDAMINKIRDTETILLQQSRINTELQEGLMSSRLVPLSRLVPRLRRLVRQIGSELKKPSELEILNAEGELDRVVLERMVSPLEHMVRNAVGHGIEDAETRRKTGKPKVGKVVLNLTREGADVVLKLSDDGGGIDVKKIKAKAIERGLMQEKSELSDSEILQFIFAAGFSTATEVTQISGRGVGMDVVYSEIKQLGGTVSINSELGKGTTFIIRLPFTVSINRALMVQVGEDTYAIPLSHIEGIVRINPYELESHYKDAKKKSFNYAGQDYTLKYLGTHINGVLSPNFHENEKPLPVLLIRGTEHSMALQVDSVLGSREVVVKSVGMQLSTVSGISGATILGDGSVVIILDVVAMIRSELAESHVEPLRAVENIAETNKRPIVMVVDDSVTVRKVTSRVLERNGFEVLLAKDGVDAITQLQEHTPDLMLLDIEMPRMDGFEVATQVRHDRRLKDLPIIMITSRTGQKHRDRAMSIGVNEYLGKPFQEAGLLEAIEQFISRSG